MATKSQRIANLRRRSSAAMKKLESVLRIGATVLRDKILDEVLNERAERREDGLGVEARGALEAAREVAATTGQAYRDAYLTSYRLADWYRACGLDAEGRLHQGLFADEPEEEDLGAIVAGRADVRRAVVVEPRRGRRGSPRNPVSRTTRHGRPGHRT